MSRKRQKFGEEIVLSFTHKPIPVYDFVTNYFCRPSIFYIVQRCFFPIVPIFCAIRFEELLFRRSSNNFELKISAPTPSNFQPNSELFLIIPFVQILRIWRSYSSLERPFWSSKTSLRSTYLSPKAGEFSSDF